MQDDFSSSQYDLNKRRQSYRIKKDQEQPAEFGPAPNDVHNWQWKWEDEIGTDNWIRNDEEPAEKERNWKSWSIGYS